MTRILILCTGNSCRSQMAEAFLKSFDTRLEVYSAGTDPARQVHPKAIEVMKEVGIDLSRHLPKSVDEFLGQPFDYVITVCDHARETCPAFIGKVTHRVHIGFDDPVGAIGSEDDVLSVFRRVRDEMQSRLRRFYLEEIQQRLNGE